MWRSLEHNSLDLHRRCGVRAMQTAYSTQHTCIQRSTLIAYYHFLCTSSTIVSMTIIKKISFFFFMCFDLPDRRTKSVRQQ